MFFDVSTGELFEGWFKDNQLIQGRCIQDDTYYEGSFVKIKEGKEGTFGKHGKGTQYLSNGTKYDGQWNNNKKDGEGIEYFANQMRCKVQYNKGKPNGQVLFTMGQDQPSRTEKEYPTDEDKLIEISKYLYDELNKAK